MEFKPLSNKVESVMAGIQIACDFIKQGVSRYVIHLLICLFILYVRLFIYFYLYCIHTDTVKPSLSKPV